MTDTSINAFNLAIRQTPWYQAWFAQRGLNPNQVKLNNRQREELKALVERHTGRRLPGDMKIDPAGNLNEKGGWAGLPTAAKLAIIAGAAVATAGAAGAFAGPTGPASVAGQVGATEASIFGSSAAAASNAAWAGGTAAATTGGGVASTLGALAKWQTPISWGLDFFNNWQNSRAANNQFEAGLEFQHKTFEQRQKEFEASMELERQKLGLSKEQFEKQFGFLRDQHREEFFLKQEQFNKNYALNRDQLGLTRQQFEQGEANRRPYIDAGVGGLQQLARRMGTTVPGNAARIARPPDAPIETPRDSVIQASAPSGTLGQLAGGAPSSAMAVPNRGIAGTGDVVVGGPQATQVPQTGAEMPVIEMVTLQAPDGSARAVPKDQAAHYISKGARVMEGAAA